jgi:hypothetical protein
MKTPKFRAFVKKENRIFGSNLDLSPGSSSYGSIALNKPLEFLCASVTFSGKIITTHSPS